MRWLPPLLSANAGFLDTAGFLALQGLFVAHVTGNFATLGAALVLGTAGVVAKLLALPVFIAWVALSRVASVALRARGLPARRVLLALTCVLLCGFAALAIGHGRFADSDTPLALLTGMLAVAAMAVQNGVQRQFLPQSPLTTAMTGNTTTTVIDLVDLLRFAAPPPERAQLANALACIAAFVAGAVAAAGLYWLSRDLCLAVPSLLALLAVLAAREDEAAQHGG